MIYHFKSLVLVRKSRAFYATLYQEVFFGNPGGGGSLIALYLFISLVRNASFIIVEQWWQGRSQWCQKSLCKNILLVSLRLCTSAFVRAPPQLTLFTSPTTPSTPRNIRGRKFPTLEIWQSPDKFTGKSKTRICVYVYIYIAHHLWGQWNSSISRKMFLILYPIHTLSNSLCLLQGLHSIDLSNHRSID